MSPILRDKQVAEKRLRLISVHATTVKTTLKQQNTMLQQVSHQALVELAI